MNYGGWISEAPHQKREFKPSYRQIMREMRATDVPEGTSGNWEIRKRDHPAWMMLERGKAPALGTVLLCMTRETLNHDHGEVVMVDHAVELKTHLEFIAVARGRVLITGLGLGCVVRGALQNPRVEKITVVERDRHVLKLVGPYLPPEVRIIEADVRDWIEHSDETFDYAWHDLWRDVERGDPHLHIMHSEVMMKLRKRVKHQGAWKFPRRNRRGWERQGYGLQKGQKNAP